MGKVRYVPQGSVAALMLTLSSDLEGIRKDLAEIGVGLNSLVASLRKPVSHGHVRAVLDDRIVTTIGGRSFVNADDFDFDELLRDLCSVATRLETMQIRMGGG